MEFMCHEIRLIWHGAPAFDEWVSHEKIRHVNFLPANGMRYKLQIMSDVTVPLEFERGVILTL